MEIKPIGGRLWRAGAGESDIGEMEEVKGALEAALFISGDPLAPRQLAEALGHDEGKILSALQELREEYLKYNRGMQLREVGGGWRMHTHPAYAEQIERLLLSSRRARLTRAAVETLAIIAYLQPITRSQVANLRGVQSENMVKVLQEQGLVAEAGRERSPGGPVLYVTTEKFLERFGLNGLDDLPPLEDFEPDRETVQRIARSLSGQGESGEEAAPAEQQGRGDGIEDGPKEGEGPACGASTQGPAGAGMEGGDTSAGGVAGSACAHAAQGEGEAGDLGTSLAGAD